MNKPTRFTAIDFETANADYESACAVGIVVFEDGALIHDAYSLIRPPIGHDTFLLGNQRIHHITPDMVKDAPQWDTLYPVLQPWLCDTILAAHNAAFDIRILCRLNEAYGIPFEPYSYFCTVELARRLYPFLPNHKLTTITEYLQMDHNAHHADSDALGCAMIVADALGACGSDDVREMARQMLLRIKTMR